MKRKFTFLMAAFTLLAFLVPITGWGQARGDVLSYTLEPASGSNNGYANNCDITIGGITWNLTGNSTYQPWRIGGKNLTEVDRPLYSKTAIADNISKIEVTHGSANSITINSWTVIVASDAAFETVVSQLTPTFEANKTTTIIRPDGADWTGCYYKFVYNVSVTGNSNKFLEFTRAKFYKEDGGSTPTTPTTVTIDASGITNTDIYNGTAAGSLSATVMDNNNNTVIEGATVTWESNDDDIATIDANGVVTLVAVGSTTITASYAGNDTYESSSATYTIEVIDSTPSTGSNSTFIFNTDDGLEALNITKPSSGAGTDLDPDTDYTIGDVTMNITHGTTTNTRVWNSSGNTDLRVYSNGTLAFTVPEGNAITKITFDGNTIALSGVNNSVWTATGDPVNTVTFTNNATGSKIRTITVEYEATVPPTVAAPTFNPVAGSYAEPQSVTITCATEGASIYYTIDGSAPNNTSAQYTGSITVSVSTTIKAIAYVGEDYSSVTTAAYVIELPTVATPTFNLATGTYAGTQEVTITCATEDATIYYTLDGEDPTTESNVYSTPLTISETTTVKAMAVKDNYNNSAIAEATYTIIPSVPGYVIDFENAASAYTDWEFVNIVSQQTGANNVSAHGGTYYGTTGGKASGKIVTKEKIATPYILTCYVTRQSTNTTASTWYIQVSSDGEAWTNVATQSATSMSVGTWVEFTANLTQYTDVYVRLCYEGSTAVRNIDDLTLITTVPAVATPTFSPEAGTYYEAKNVTITCETEGVTIYYTTDGSDPDNGSTVYNDPIAVTQTTTIKAIAYDAEDNASAIGTATYTIVSMQTIAQVREQGTGDVLTTGTITSISGNGTKTAYMQDATAAIVVYGSFTAAVGDEIRVSGTLSDFNGLLEITSPQVTVISSGNTIEPTLMTIAEINTSTNQGWYIRIEDATVTAIEGNYTTIAQGENTVNVYKINSVNVDDVISFNGNIGYHDGLQIVNPTEVTVGTSGYAYQYSINGVLGEVQHGTDITLANGEAVGGLAFAGWTLNPNDVDNILAAGDSYELTADGVIFYAVYSRSVDMATHTYVKVTEAPEDWSGKYLIVYETGGVAFDGGLQTLDAANNTINVSFDGDAIISNYATNAAVFTFAPIYNNEQVITGYSIKSTSGYYIGKTANANGLDYSTKTVYQNTLSIDEGNNVVITASGGCTMRYNAASDQKRFRYFKSGQKAVQLYKQEGEADFNTSYYTRVFNNETATADIEIVGPSIIPSGSSLNMNYSYSITNALGADKFIIEDGAQLDGYYSPVSGTMLKNINACNYVETNNAGYYLITSPFDVEPSAVNGMITSNYDLYAYDPSEDLEWRNFKAGEFTSLTAGHGYLYANGDGTTLEFAGTLNASFLYINNLNYDGGDELNSLTLAGNPAAMNVEYCLYNQIREGGIGADEGEETNFLYLNSAGDGFLVEHGTSFTAQPLQGFFVQATGANQYILEAGAAIGEEPGDFKGNLNIKVNRNSQLIDNAIVSFGNGSMMKKFYLSETSTRVYIPQNGKDYAVVRSANEGEMPVNFKAETNGTYTISVNTDNVEMNYLHLIDNKTGADVDLLVEPSYSFEANTDDYASRFRLMFKANANVSENAEAESFAFFNGSTWTVSNLGEATLQVVDVTGRMISSETVNGNAEISINQTPGVYMIRLINGDNVKVQKVVVR